MRVPRLGTWPAIHISSIPPRRQEKKPGSLTTVEKALGKLNTEECSRDRFFKNSAATDIAIRLERSRNESHERSGEGMERATPPGTRRGRDTYPEHDMLPWKGPVARFAAIGTLALLLITACASAFSMLIWEPAADPPAAASLVVSGQSRRTVSATRPGVLHIRRRTLHRAGRNVSSRSVLRSCPPRLDPLSRF
jgi:hypothetical protein